MRITRNDAEEQITYNFYIQKNWPIFITGKLKKKKKGKVQLTVFTI